MDKKVDEDGFIEVRNKLTRKLKNRKIRVERIVKTGPGNVALEFENAAQQLKVEEILRAEPLNGSKLRSSSSNTVAVALRGIPKELTKDEVERQLKEENPDHPVFQTSDWELKLLDQSVQGTKYKIGKLTTSLNSARIILKNPKIYLEWITLKADLWKPNHRRYSNCFETGHIGAKCNGRVRCSVCSGPHKADQCTSKRDHPDCAQCIVCLRAKQKADHQATLKECPILMKEQMDQFSKVYNNVYYG